jgi:hypothetical protein
MDTNELKKLNTGDIVKSNWDGKTYIVTGNYGDRVTAVRTVDITNSSEWELVIKANYEEEKEEEGS